MVIFASNLSPDVNRAVFLSALIFALMIATWVAVFLMGHYQVISQFLHEAGDEYIAEKEKQKPDVIQRQKKNLSLLATWIWIAVFVLWVLMVNVSLGSIALYSLIALTIFGSAIAYLVFDHILGDLFEKYIGGPTTRLLKPILDRLEARADKIDFMLIDPYPALLDEVDWYRERLYESWKNLGFFDVKTKWGLRYEFRVRRERTVVTRERIYHKILIAKADGVLGRVLNMLPPGVAIKDLISEETRIELCTALEAEVNFHLSVETGLWVAITRHGYENTPESYKPYLDRHAGDVLLSDEFIFDEVDFTAAHARLKAGH